MYMVKDLEHFAGYLITTFSEFPKGIFHNFPRGKKKIRKSDEGGTKYHAWDHHNSYAGKPYMVCRGLAVKSTALKHVKLWCF